MIRVSSNRKVRVRTSKVHNSKDSNLKINSSSNPSPTNPNPNNSNNFVSVRPPTTATIAPKSMAITPSPQQISSIWMLLLGTFHWIIDDFNVQFHLQKCIKYYLSYYDIPIKITCWNAF